MRRGNYRGAVSCADKITPKFRQRIPHAILVAAVAAAIAPATVSATPTVQMSSDSGGNYDLVNNGTISFKVYTSGNNEAKVTSIQWAGQEMVGSKGLYYDVQGNPNIYYGTGSVFSAPVIGNGYVIISATNPATTATPLQTTLSWILRDGDAGFSTYEYYHHTTAMADYSSNENRLGAEFFNDTLFHYSSVADDFWGYQAAGDPCAIRAASSPRKPPTCAASPTNTSKTMKPNTTGARRIKIHPSSAL